MSITTQVSKPKQYLKLTTKKKAALLKFIQSGKPASRWLRKHKITHNHMYSQLASDSAFKQEYLRARSNQAHALADQMIEISDEVEEDPASRRIRVDTRKWLASKLNSEAYGDKLQVETTTKVSLIEHLQEITKNVTPTAEQLED